MHTIQYIAVQGDDVDQAFRRVKHELEAMLGDWPESPTNTWFDWFVTGGGRWSTSEDSYNDEYQDDVGRPSTAPPAPWPAASAASSRPRT